MVDMLPKRIIIIAFIFANSGRAKCEEKLPVYDEEEPPENSSELTRNTERSSINDTLNTNYETVGNILNYPLLKNGTEHGTNQSKNLSQQTRLNRQVIQLGNTSSLEENTSSPSSNKKNQSSIHDETTKVDEENMSLNTLHIKVQSTTAVSLTESPKQMTITDVFKSPSLESYTKTNKRKIEAKKQIQAAVSLTNKPYLEPQSKQSIQDIPQVGNRVENSQKPKTQQHSNSEYSAKEKNNTASARASLNNSELDPKKSFSKNGENLESMTEKKPCHKLQGAESKPISQVVKNNSTTKNNLTIYGKVQTGSFEATPLTTKIPQNSNNSPLATNKPVNAKITNKRKSLKEKWKVIISHIGKAIGVISLFGGAFYMVFSVM